MIIILGARDFCGMQVQQRDQQILYERMKLKKETDS